MIRHMLDFSDRVHCARNRAQERKNVFAEQAGAWTTILTVMLAVHVAPVVIVIMLTRSGGALAVAVVTSGFIYLLLMPIPDFGCGSFAECGGGVVVDTLMKPFVLICWGCLIGAAAIKSALLMLAGRRASPY
jgi:hypothetical protein